MIVCVVLRNKNYLSLGNKDRQKLKEGVRISATMALNKKG